MLLIFVVLYVFVEEKDVSVEYNSNLSYSKVTPSLQVLRRVD